MLFGTRTLPSSPGQMSERDGQSKRSGSTALEPIAVHSITLPRLLTAKNKLHVPTSPRVKMTMFWYKGLPVTDTHLDTSASPTI